MSDLRFVHDVLGVAAILPGSSKQVESRHASLPVGLAVRALGPVGTLADPAADRRTGWVQRGDLVVFLLCVPAGFVFGTYGPWTLAVVAVAALGGPPAGETT